MGTGWALGIAIGIGCTWCTGIDWACSILIGIGCTWGTGVGTGCTPGSIWDTDCTQDPTCCIRWTRGISPDTGCTSPASHLYSGTGFWGRYSFFPLLLLAPSWAHSSVTPEVSTAEGFSPFFRFLPRSSSSTPLHFAAEAARPGVNRSLSSPFLPSPEGKTRGAFASESEETEKDQVRGPTVVQSGHDIEAGEACSAQSVPRQLRGTRLPSWT